jgi:hypothetical protein
LEQAINMLTNRKKTTATVANATWHIKYCIVFHNKQKISEPKLVACKKVTFVDRERDEKKLAY